MSEHLAKYCDHEVVIVIASVGPASEVDKAKYVCGICGFALAELGKCPRCKPEIEETGKRLGAMGQRQEQVEGFGGIVENR